jgi:predicted DNA-binding transcriptional regulator YafY
MTLHYFAKYREESSCRIIEPVGLCFYGYNWHLIAFCRLRNDYRDFRLDRIQNLEIDNDCVSVNVDITISDYFNQIWKTEDLFNVVVDFKDEVAAQIADSKYFFGFYEQNNIGNGIQMRFAVNDLIYIANWLLSLEEKVVRVVEPIELRTIMINKVTKLANLYSELKNKIFHNKLEDSL